jgi:predicted acyltransferase
MLWFGWKDPIDAALFMSWLPPFQASLAFALANLAFWYAILWTLDRKGLHLRV